jgi:hypothetical protein
MTKTQRTALGLLAVARRVEDVEKVRVFGLRKWWVGAEDVRKDERYAAAVVKELTSYFADLAEARTPTKES